MPAVIVPAALTAISTIGGAVIGPALLGGAFGTVTQAVLGNALFGALLAGGAAALGGKPKTPDFAAFAARARDLTRVIRSSTSAQRVIYGEAMASGPLVFADGTGSANTYLHLVVALAGHEVEQIGTVWLNDITSANSRVSAYTRLRKHLGAPSQVVDPDLTADVAKWDSTHRLRGRAYLYARLEWNADAWPTGIPNIRAEVKGKKLWDPRDTGATISTATILTGSTVQIVTSAAHGFSTGDWVFISGHGDKTIAGEYAITVTGPTAFEIDEPNVGSATGGSSGGTATKMKWSDNLALCVLDYLTNDFGIRAHPDDEVDGATFIAAANICDEIVTLTTTSDTFTVSAISEDEIELPDDDLKLKTGETCTVSSTGTLPAGLAAATTYNYIRTSATTGKFATSLANARAGTSINITDTGTGTHTINRTGQPRYTANGIVDLEASPIAIMEDMLTAGAAALVYAQGEYRLFVGAATSSTLTLTISDLRGDIRVRSRTPKKDLYNAVRGTFVDQDQFWQPADFPPMTNVFYEGQDNDERLFRDIELPFTTDAIRAQRIAKVHLEKSRQPITVEWPAKLNALQLSVWDVVSVTVSALGWTAKEFRVIGWMLAEDGGVDLVLQEEAAASYNWAGGSATVLDAAPDTTLPNPFSVAAPTNLVLTSGSGELYLASDGTVVSRIRAAWTASVDQFVTHYEVQSRNITTGETYQPGPVVQAGTTELYLWDVEDGENYDVRVRAVNSAGVHSSWVEVLAHTVVGKTAAPGDVTGFSAQQNGSVVTFRWNQVSDLDLAGYEIRYMKAPFTWASAIVLTAVTRGTLVTNTGLPPGTWTVAIKARDTSENYSVNATTYGITVGNANTQIKQNIEDPNWRGALTSMLNHWPSQRLVPDSRTLASAMTDAQLWDQMTFDPYTLCYYESTEIDVGFAADGLRVWATIVGGIGPGESGVADPQLEIDYHDGITGSGYDGFEGWTVGTVNDAQYLKGRVKIDTRTGVAWISDFELNVDGALRTEQAAGVTVAVAGSAISFGTRYVNTPSVQITARPSGSTPRFPTYESASGTGFTAKVWDAAGADVGGTIDWTATGV